MTAKSLIQQQWLQSMDEQPEINLADISEQEYLDERLHPQPGEPLYLVLSDLILALRPLASTAAIKILDLGCGGSPYRSLYPNAIYHRADIAGTEQIDFEIPTGLANWQLPVDAGVYDLVLSSQVLEHVLDSTSYLNEAFRVLKTGGKLVLSTHGTFEDHGCPYDFRRWTADGLAADLTSSGFNVVQMSKLTTGPRAGLFILQRFRKSYLRMLPLAWSMFWLKWMLKLRRASFDRQCDACFDKHRVVSSEQSEHVHNIYIGLLAVAVK